MTLLKQKRFYLAGFILAALFVSLFFVRTYYRKPSFQTNLNTENVRQATAAGHETWKSIYLNEEKIGYAFSAFSPAESGYRTREKVFLRLNAMGMVQNMNMTTTGNLNGDFTLNNFKIDIRSGLFNFEARAQYENGKLTVTSSGSRDVQNGTGNIYEIKMSQAPYLPAGIIQDVLTSDWAGGDTFSYPLFDPVTMTLSPARVTIRGDKTIELNGEKRKALAFSIEFKGMTQELFTNDTGNILMEKGLMGIKLVACSRSRALKGIGRSPSEDITELAAVPVEKQIQAPEKLQKLTLKISGINPADLAFDTPRQTLSGSTLTIEKENLTDLQPQQDITGFEKFKSPSPFIQSDDDTIRKTALNITRGADTALEKVENLMIWVNENIVKTPVITVPDALSTLERRKGDCNEHAVLLTALARAVNIPARVETGLCYLKGKFRYHAWNAFFVGKWVTADAVFRQMPADVTHISLTSAGMGSESELAGIIGKIQIQIVRFDPS